MSIDLRSETIITLGEACRWVPPNGISDATIARWIQKGRNGVTLETVRIGGRRLTSVEALERFIVAQNETQTPVAAVSPAQRRRQAEAAQVALREMLEAE